MKKHYNTPSLVLIGDMVNNTLGASGTGADSGSKSRQAGGNGSQSSNKSFNDRSFNNNDFNR
jgi:hypothetical protein